MKSRVFLPAIMSGPLLWAAYFPLDLGLISLIALVPWLTLVRAEGVSPRRRYFAAYLGGLAFYVPVLQWIRVAHPAMYASWIGLALYCSLFHVLALYLLRQLDRLGKPPLVLTLPLVWVPLEYLRAHFPTGFPLLSHLGMFQHTGFAWYFLGHSLHNITPLIQVADIGGVYPLTMLVAMFNGMFFDWFVRFPRIRTLLRWPAEHKIGFYREMWLTAGVATVMVTFVIYGTSRLQHLPFQVGPRVAAIQADIPQDAKMGDQKELFRRYDDLNRRAAARADLVVWPETCFPYSISQLAPGTPRDSIPAEFRENMLETQEVMDKLATMWRANVLLGLSSYEWDGTTEWRYNSAILVAPDGTLSERYDKIHLVPFGEYVPFRKTFPWLQAFTPYTGEYSCRPGERMVRFPLMVGDTQYTFGCLICYEDTDPSLARKYVRPNGDDPVDFLVNISNDGWFRGTAEHEQHLALCRFRAVEARRSVVRAVNMGISAVIDPDGRVIALPGDSWAESKRMDGIVTEKVPIDTRASIYAWAGDWVPVTFGSVLVLLLIGLRFRKRPDPH